MTTLNSFVPLNARAISAQSTLTLRTPSLPDDSQEGRHAVQQPHLACNADENDEVECVADSEESEDDIVALERELAALHSPQIASLQDDAAVTREEVFRAAEKAGDMLTPEERQRYCFYKSARAPLTSPVGPARVVNKRTFEDQKLAFHGKFDPASTTERARYGDERGAEMRGTQMVQECPGGDDNPYPDESMRTRKRAGDELPALQGVTKLRRTASAVQEASTGGSLSLVRKVLAMARRSQSAPLYMKANANAARAARASRKNTPNAQPINTPLSMSESGHGRGSSASEVEQQEAGQQSNHGVYERFRRAYDTERTVITLSKGQTGSSGIQIQGETCSKVAKYARQQSGEHSNSPRKSSPPAPRPVLRRGLFEPGNSPLYLPARWCYCRGLMKGMMVRCSEDKCEVGWYHNGCLSKDDKKRLKQGETSISRCKRAVVMTAC